MSETLLYLGVLDNGFVQRMKLVGIRRYADARRWKVVTVPAADSTPERLPFLLARHRPVGCIVECFGNETRLMPKSFGSLPAVWLDVPSETHGDIDGRLSVCVDDKAIARTALRELSANFPKSLAAVEYQWFPHEERRKWSRDRAEAFRALATAEEFPCEVFDSRPGESPGERTERLAHWLSRLPRPSGVFAVNDGAAFNVRAACRAAGLSIPRDISIVGVDNDVVLCEAIAPALSSIQIDFERMGYVAARLLGKVAEGPPSRATSADMRKLVRPMSTTVGPLLVVRRRSTGGRGRREPSILEAVEMIRREACDGLTAEMLARRFPGTRRFFNMRFREATGHSVLDEILHVRLERAFTLLAETKTAIGAIYALCGFRSNRALDYLFHARFGMSMREWRMRNARK